MTEKNATNIGEGLTSDIERLAAFSAETTRRNRQVQKADNAIHNSGDPFLIEIWDGLSQQHKITAILMAEEQTKIKED